MTRFAEAMFLLAFMSLIAAMLAAAPEADALLVEWIGR